MIYEGFLLGCAVFWISQFWFSLHSHFNIGLFYNCCVRTRDIEKREKDGSITIIYLKQIAREMDMELVYGFVPNDGSLDALIERRARELATAIVLRTANTMKL